MDYKDTLNLPRTDFAMKADLVAREPQRLEKWAAVRLYEQIQAARAGAEKFLLHDGPPFANGDVHIGNALNKILKDIIIKFHTLRGRHAPYVPGWDCHGLPIEFKVSQEMRNAGEATTDAAKIRLECEIYARRFIDIQRAQFKRLGVLGDWEHPYLTLNKEYEADELRLFADIVEKGFVYRGKKPVYWSIPARTALAEAEVEYADHVSQSVFVKFPVVGQPGLSLVIWTTTPWTLPANLAVAFNNGFQYVTARVGEERFILFRGLLAAVAEKCGWSDYEEKPFPVEDLARLEYQHPFCNRTGKLHAAEFVTSDTGTGFVHIAPGHGLDDYNLGLRAGLPIYSPIDDNGCFTHTNDLPVAQQMPAEMVGKAILEKHGKSDANEAVLHELRLRKALLKQENYHHSYPHCWRSKTPIIFRAMDQWFIRIDHVPVAATVRSQAIPSTSTTAEKSARDLTVAATFRQFALDAIHAVNWIPDWGKNRIESAVKSRPDWCISRQRSWGVPIPAFYDAQGGSILDPRIVRAAADLVQHHGSNVWFERSAAELWSLLRPKDWQGPEAAAKSTDTLDVWIDSGSSWRAVTSRRPELARNRSAALPVGSTGLPGNEPSGSSALQPFQADMYLEGSDQHRGWFQSSLLLSLAGNGAPPYKTVLTHGFMVDEDREKISKSKQSQGAYHKPQTAEAYVKKWGADVLRLWVASQDYRNDIIVSEKRIEKVGETYRILRNALRYQLSNLYDFDPAKHIVPDAALTGLDRWILGEFARLEAAVLPAYEAYEFHAVYQKLSQFAAVELSAIYHDAVKDRLYTDPANSPRRRSTQTALHRMVTQLCQMLSPILVFTTDEAWEFVPGRPANAPHVHLATWAPTTLVRSDAEQTAWRRLFEIRERVLPHLEKERQAKTIGKALDARVTLTGSDPMLIEGKAHGEALRELLNVSQLEVHVEPANGEPTLNVVVAKAAGQKCERCWHWEEDVGSVAEHPTICGRCVEAVSKTGSGN
jgi:isoleucyl-tRNA synthetase